MSQTIDDSPNSDNKMDISDPTTISQESIGLSPDADEQNSLMTHTERIEISTAPSLNNKIQCTSKTNSGSDINFIDTKLDNRNLINKYSHTNQKQRANATKVEMHPLMEPVTKSDDDDDDDDNNDDDDDDDNVDLSPVDNSSLIIDSIPNQIVQINNSVPPETPTKSPRTLLVKKFDLLELPNTKQLQDDKQLMSSGESEPDVSQYQALVEPTFQSVSLTNHNVDKLCAAAAAAAAESSSKSLNHHLRKTPLTNERKLMATHEDSSVETVSNNSFDYDDDDDDVDDVDGFNFKGIKNLSKSTSKNGVSTNGDGDGTTNNAKTAINMITNIDNTNVIINENVNSKIDASHQTTVTLSDGQIRNIDMKVIEPYKRCLSHGGYIKSPGHNAIVIFSACYLPDRSRPDYHYVMENLFLYVIKTLNQFVTDDYILIYLHGGSRKSTIPPFPWLKKSYQLLDRKIRKSLKNVYMVHPTFWLKSIVWMARPFISSKFWRKLVYIRSLDDLYKIIPVEKAAVPEKVKLYDMKKNTEHRNP